MGVRRLCRMEWMFWVWEMELAVFVETLDLEVPPEGISGALLALWWDGKGEWAQAHVEAQAAGSREGDWVHAYLHRKEGDTGNAGYWYSRSREPFFDGSFDDEWTHIAKKLLV